MGATRNLGYIENLISYDGNDNIGIGGAVNVLYKVTIGGNMLASGTLNIGAVTNAGVDTDKFLVLDTNGTVRFRTGAELASDIGPANLSASTLKHVVKLGETVSKGQAVYVSSADGTNMIVSKASNASEATSSKTLGLVETNGVLNDQVNVITEGLLAGLDTSTAVIGDPVWLGTSGNIIFGLANKPYAPAHLVFIGVVTRVQQNNGEIFVKVQNGFEIQELHNVQITSTPTDNQVLTYETATSLYKMKTVDGANVTGYALTKTDDTNVTLTLGGSASTSLLRAASLTLGWTGQLAISRGGTGLSALGTDGQLLRVNSGATALEYWTPTYISAAITSLNGLSGATQTFATGTSGTDFGISSSTTIHTFNLPTASATNRGALSSTDWSTFNSKQNAITLTTTGSSGASTFISSTLNIPTYTLSGLGGVPTTRIITINGTAQDLSVDRTWSVGTVTSVSALTIGTTGTDITSTVATGTTTPVITINIPTASATNRGALSSADWSTFNSKQNTITLTTTGTSGAATLVGSTLNIPNYTGGGTTLNGTGFVRMAGTTVSYITGTSSQFVKADGSLDGTGYEPTVTKGNLTSANTAHLTVTGGTGAIIGSGVNLTILPGAIVNSGLGLTTTGNSGAATFSNATLNIPNYTLAGLGGLPLSGGTLSGILYSTYNTASARSNLSFNVSSTLLGNIHIQNGAGPSGSANQAAITFMGSSTTASQAGIYVLNDNSNGTSMGFATTESYATGPQLFMTATNNGIVNFPRATPTVQGNSIWHSGNLTPSNYLPLSGGTMTGNVIASGDTYTTYGPNSSWSSYLRVGGNGRTVSGNTYASVVTTNGNLHLDSGDGRSMYLNYYAGTGGIAFGTGASGVAAWMGPDGDLWKGSADNTGTQYVYNSGTWSIRITGFANAGAPRLYSTDGSYNYDAANPYYGYLTYDGSRWLFQVSPATPAAVRVAYSDLTGSVAWTNVSGRPTAVSSFTNDSGYITANSTPYFGITNNSSTTGNGISLYGLYTGGEMSYGIMFAGTGTFGGYGDVAGNDWATYFMMNNSLTRGWIFRRNQTANVASISGAGNATFAGYVGAVDVYTQGGWFRNHTNNNGIYWSGTAWHLYPKNSSDFYVRSGASDASILFMRNGTEANYIHNASDNAIGFLSTGRSWIFRVDNSGNATAYGSLTSNGLIRVNGNTNLYLDYNYGCSIVGVYTSTRYQGVFAMGDAYKLPIDGTSTGNLYGMCWSHPNAGGVAGNLNTHGLLVLENGTFLAAISGSIRARDNMMAPIYYDRNDTAKYLTRNTSSYGSWYMGGSNNGYSGWRVDGGMNLMIHTNGVSAPCGFFHESLGWSILTYTNSSQYLYHNTSEKFRTDSGGVVITGTLYATGDVIAFYSDIRLKKDIVEIDSAVDKIKKLRGVTYTWNDNEVNIVKERAGTRDIGLIAQEVEAIEPLLITEYETQLNTPSNNPEEAANFKARMSEKYKTIKYDKLVALLVEGMKEQQKQIEELKSQIKNK